MVICDMELLNTILTQVFSPPILFFTFGIFAALIKSNLKIPEAMSSAMSIFLLCAIGLKGGVGIAEADIRLILLPAAAASALGGGTVLLGYFILRKLRLDTPNAGMIAGHYGAVAVAAVIVGFAFLGKKHVPFEKFILAVYPFMAISAIICAIILTRYLLAKKGSTGVRFSLRSVLKLGLLNRAVILLISTMLIGWIVGPDGTKRIMPFFDGMFEGVLSLFLLDMGLFAAQCLGEWRGVGLRLVAYAIIMPPIYGLLGVLFGAWAGLSVGGATMLGVMAGSASFIEAPAALRIAIPEANPALAITASIALTFPFTVVIGIPLYYAVAQMISGS